MKFWKQQRVLRELMYCFPLPPSPPLPLPPPPPSGSPSATLPPSAPPLRQPLPRPVPHATFPPASVLTKSKQVWGVTSPILPPISKLRPESVPSIHPSLNQYQFLLYCLSDSILGLGFRKVCDFFLSLDLDRDSSPILPPLPSCSFSIISSPILPPLPKAAPRSISPIRI